MNVVELLQKKAKYEKENVDPHLIKRRENFKILEGLIISAIDEWMLDEKRPVLEYNIPIEYCFGCINEHYDYWYVTNDDPWRTVFDILHSVVKRYQTKERPLMFRLTMNHVFELRELTYM